MFEDQNKKLPFKKAIFWIFLSTLLISGSSGAGLFYYWNVKRMHQKDPNYNIVAIVQRGPDKDILHTEYLAELLDLSLDKPTNLEKLRIEVAKKKLLQSPLIQSVDVKKVKPGTLYIDYRVRKPIAYFGEYSNTAIDEEGVLIPFAPFFTPKKLPELISEFEEEQKWGNVLKGEYISWALQLLKKYPQIRRIDLSQSHASSLGQREIVLILEEQQETRLLRLSTEDIKHQLANYKILDDYLKNHPQDAKTLIIDLRVKNLAFLTKDM